MTNATTDQPSQLVLPDDVDYLRRQGVRWAATQEGGHVCLVIAGFRLPAGYSSAETDLLIRLPAGFPDAAPDMWWCDPWVRLVATGQPPPNADQTESYLGRPWQRWSRHFPDPSAWKAGRSGVESYMTIIRKDFEKWVSR
jgi:hypothetical protein